MTLHLIESDFQRELAEIETENMCQTPLEPGLYLHVIDAEVTEVLVTGVARSDIQAADLVLVF